MSISNSQSNSSVQNPELNEQTIKIKAASKGNGLTSMVVGIIALLIGFSLLGVIPQQFILIAIGCIAIGIIAVVIGFFKIKEPEHSLVINPNGIQYHHRNGQWFIPWDNIQRIDCPRVTKGLSQVDLQMVGIRIKSYPDFLSVISQRLMTNTLMEQRPLLMQNMDDSCQTGQCPSNDLIEEAKYKLADGQILTGVKGMFANRMHKLRDRLGYDVYINEAELDRSANDFVILLRNCHADVSQRAD